MWRELTLSTARRAELVDITGQVQAVIADSGVREGICVIYSPHTTAGITINENADPDVARDVLTFLDRAVSQAATGFRHREGNADSHVKASLMGASATVIVREGRAALGTWQGIYFCEFDGPRRRAVWIRVIPGA